jgi:hypothetical protein
VISSSSPGPGGQLYEPALDGERCWIRHPDGRLRILRMHRWLGAYGANEEFDDAVVALCSGPMIELGCGPACLVARLVQREVPVVGGDRSIGIRASLLRLESARRVGPWFRWAFAGVDGTAMLGRDVGLRITGVHLIRAGELSPTWPYCER